jgi:hypothetical protein
MMKLRLVPAPLTEEDDVAWDHTYGRWVDVRVGDTLFVASDALDRRDADLMLYAQQNRRYGWVRTDGQREMPIRQYVQIRGGSSLGAV